MATNALAAGLAELKAIDWDDWIAKEKARREALGPDGRAFEDYAKRWADMWRDRFA